MKNDGGAAFPCPREYSIVSSGMTVRQFYKAAAIKGLLANPGGPIQANGMTGWNYTNCGPTYVVNFCTEIADAMIAEDEAFAAREGKG